MLKLVNNGEYCIVGPNFENSQTYDLVKRSQQLITPRESEIRPLNVYFDKQEPKFFDEPFEEWVPLNKAISTMPEFAGIELESGENYDSMSYNPESQTIADWENQYLYEWSHFVKKFTVFHNRPQLISIQNCIPPLLQGRNSSTKEKYEVCLFYYDHTKSSIVSALFQISRRTTFSEWKKTLPMDSSHEKCTFKIFNPLAFNYQTFSSEPICDEILIEHEDDPMEFYFALFDGFLSFSTLRNDIVFPISFGLHTNRQTEVSSTELKPVLKSRFIEFDYPTSKWVLAKGWIEHYKLEEQETSISELFAQIVKEFLWTQKSKEPYPAWVFGLSPTPFDEKIDEWIEEMNSLDDSQRVEWLMKKTNSTAIPVSTVWHNFQQASKKWIESKRRGILWKQSILYLLQNSILEKNEILDWEILNEQAIEHKKMGLLSELYIARTELRKKEWTKELIDIPFTILANQYMGVAHYSEPYIHDLYEYLKEIIMKPPVHFVDGKNMLRIFIDLFKRQQILSYLTWKDYLNDLLKQKTEQVRDWNSIPIIQKNEILSVQQALLIHQTYANTQQGRESFATHVNEEQFQFLKMYKQIYQAEQAHIAKKLSIMKSVHYVLQTEMELDYRSFKSYVPWINWEKKKIEGMFIGIPESTYSKRNWQVKCAEIQEIDQSAQIYVCGKCGKKRILQSNSPVELMSSQFKIQTLEKPLEVVEFGYVLELDSKESIYLPHDCVIVFLKNKPNGLVGRYFVDPKTPSLTRFQSISSIQNFERTEEWFYLKLDHLDVHPVQKDKKCVVFEKNFTLENPISQLYYILPENSTIQLLSIDNWKSTEVIHWSCTNPFNHMADLEKLKKIQTSYSKELEDQIHSIPESITFDSLNSTFPCPKIYSQNSNNTSEFLGTPTQKFNAVNATTTNPTTTAINTATASNTATTNTTNTITTITNPITTTTSSVIEPVPTRESAIQKESSIQKESVIQKGSTIDTVNSSNNTGSQEQDFKDKLDEYVESIEEIRTKIHNHVKDESFQNSTQVKEKEWKPEFLVFYEKYKNLYSQEDWNELSRCNDKWIYYHDGYLSFKPAVTHTDTEKNSNVIHVQLSAKDIPLNSQLLENTFSYFPHGATVNQLCRKIGQSGKKNCQQVRDLLNKEPQKFHFVANQFYLFKIPTVEKEAWKAIAWKNAKKAKVTEQEWNQKISQF